MGTVVEAGESGGEGVPAATGRRGVGVLDSKAAAHQILFVVDLGTFEIPQAARALAASGRYDAIVTLGVIIRGGTPHFDYVCDGVTAGVREVMRDTQVPLAFGVLTTDDVAQALARAGGEVGNKGCEAALAAVEMARLLARLAAPGDAP